MAKAKRTGGVTLTLTGTEASQLAALLMQRSDWFEEGEELFEDIYNALQDGAEVEEGHLAKHWSADDD